MSINPIESFPPAKNAATVNLGARSNRAETGPESDAAEEATPPDSGTLPEQERSFAKNASSTYELPQDVVEVHQDPEIKDQVIIQYLDQAKNVVLQVPSSEELAVERGIAQEFQQAAKLRANEGSPAPASEGGKTHGD